MADIYREALLERLANPTNQGKIPKPEIEARLVNTLCGDEVLIQLRVRNGIIEQAVYSGNGCAISQVSADFLAEKLQGKNIKQIENITEKDILKTLGINPGPARLKCALLSFEVLKKALEK